MKMKFHVVRPLRNPAGLSNIQQPAKAWLAELMSGLGDQLKDGGNGRIQLSLDNGPGQAVKLEFRLVEAPGFKTITLDLPTTPP